MLGATIGLLLLVALVSVVGHTAVEISSDNRYYRTYFGLLGLRLGRWQLLPPVTGVTLKFFSTQGSGPAPSAGSWST
ncbi:MAG: hypothetical protein EOO59_21150 [Hymenobacter sp.]|nr:MAG: hypothetical protein EOO59_21150 [Hymenobacter sp.]